MNEVVLLGYVPLFLTSGVALFIVTYIVRKRGKIYSYDKIKTYDSALAYADSSMVEFTKRNEGRINTILLGAAAVYILVFALGIAPPYLRDLPYVLNNQYSEGRFQALRSYDGRVAGTTGQAMGGRPTPMLNLETGEEVKMRMGFGELQAGEVFVLEYLPNTGINRVISFEGVRPLPLDISDSW